MIVCVVWCGEVGKVSQVPGVCDSSIVWSQLTTYLVPLIFIDLFLNTRGVSHSS